MVHDYFLDRVKEERDKRKRALSSLDSPEAALRYRKRVRVAIKEAFGPFPAKTPLNTEVKGEIKRPGFRLEKLIFESRPGVQVTANLYLPSGGSGKHPGVVVPCGHSIEGKAGQRYQELCTRLASSGFMALIYDPFSQGERNQYLDYSGPESRALGKRCVYAHNMAGKQLELTGGFFGSWRAWDGIRALDCLLSRPEVDENKVGVTGNSGGGTLTTWLWALDERFTMGAPSCFITTFLANLENELPADCEQCPPGIIGSGLEMADFLISRAPEPVIILGQKYDYFDPRGLEEAFSEVKRFYEILGAGDSARHFIGGSPHGYYPDAQERMVSFFCRHAGLTKKKIKNITVSKPGTLFAAPGGEVLKNGALPIYDIIRGEAEELAEGRKSAGGADLPERLREVLKLPGADSAPHYRVLRPVRLKGLLCARFAVETEKNIKAVVGKLLPGGGRTFVIEPAGEVKVYVPHLSSEADVREGELPAGWLQDPPCYVIDARGLGESFPDEAGDFLEPYGMDYMFHAYSLMLGESYLGRRVHDCVSVLRLLSSEGARKYTFPEGARAPCLPFLRRFLLQR